MPYFSRTQKGNVSQVIYNNKGGDIDIKSTDGGKILVNGVLPTGGGGISLPINGVGDITVTGNITANGDGINTGKLEGQAIKSIDNIVIAGKK